MRLNVSFITLLLVATAALGVELRAVPAARDGDGLARVLAFAFAIVLALAVVLLLRIVRRVDELRRAERRNAP
jgi:hypothetical protein